LTSTTLETNHIAITRRLFGAGTLGLGLAAAGLRSAAAQGTPEVSAISAHLFVADPSAAVIYVYSAASLKLTGQIDGVTFGNHNGLIALPDGRLIFSDDAASELVAMRISDDGVPEIVARCAISIGDIAAWSAADPEFRYVATASAHPDTSEQIVNLVNLATFENREIPVSMVGEEELHVWLTADHLYTSLGGQVNGYSLEDLESGTVDPVGSVQVELGSHGGATDVARGRLLLTTTPGFEVVDVSTGAPVHLSTLPWDADGFTGGRNARPRLGWDGDHVFGVLTKPVDDPANWAEAEVTVHITNLATDSVRRVALGRGRFAGRWGLGEDRALFAGYNVDGGAAYLFDVASDSPAFGSAIATIALELPTAAAIVDTVPETTAQGYVTAITRDGSLGFVSHGGDGAITVIDSATSAIAATISTPTPLTGGGYLAVIESGVTPVDLWGR
jgi:hypothetical protein